MKSLSRKRLTTRSISLAICLMMLTMVALSNFDVSAFDKDKKAEKVKKADKESKSKDDKDDDDDKPRKDKEEDKKSKDKDKDDDDDDEDKDDDDEDKEDEDKDDDDKDKDDDDEDDDDKDEDDDKDKDDDEDEDDDKDKDDDDEDDDKKDDKDDVKNIAAADAKPTSISEAAGESSTSTATASSSSAVLMVSATVETDPVPVAGDAADDPAIWVDPKDASRSVIIGSNKLGGLAVYSLAGKQLQFLPDGLMNNVDIRTGFSLNGKETAIITASNRQDNSIAIYRLNPTTRQLENAAARKITTAPAYGSCMYRSPKTGKFYYFVTGKSGDVEQWELLDAGGKVDAKRVRGFKLKSTVEGCVADDELGHFYVSEEVVGIWKYDAEPDAEAKGVLIDKAGSGGRLTADVEGLTIAYGADGSGYLIASSQGDNSYVVYRREGNNEFVKTFKIVQGNGIDGTEETDGVDVTMANLGPAFPYGVFVVQDGVNDKGNQNFKLVPLQHILK